MHITTFSSVFEGHQCESVIDSPFKDKSLNIEIVGSCNGLILMRCSKDYLGSRRWLWNPCTKELKGIVNPTIKHGLLDYHGIGYNRDTDDYSTIVVATRYIERYSNRYRVYEIELCTLGSKLRNTVFGIVSYEIISMDGKAEAIFVFGAFHWIGRRLPSNRLCIVSFDIRRENFIEVVVTPLVSDILNNVDNNHKALGDLAGCLCFIRTYGGFNIDVWVMKDYNVSESWTKLFIARLPVVEKSINSVKLLWEFKNGEVLFVTTTESDHKNRLVLYDPVSKKSKVTIIQHTARNKWNIEAYAERSRDA
ncbi:F-box protein CPR1-like [Papaver somniferum]|uniref:F-box protein CPR1-like n=1 Tax=Papaver somniferum TaxID=3469 RepID=UPI000E703B2F|nr:F-box protein CPR1-like [Papaver somniferum]